MIRGRYRLRATLATAAAAAVALAGCGSSASSSASGASSSGTASGSTSASNKSPIVVGYISSLTGNASSTFSDSPGGAQAVIDQANANGGVNGHPLKLVVKDDQSSPSGDLTAAQDLVQQDHAMLVINYSSYAFGAEQYLLKAGIPVISSAFDGPEWTVPSNTNMFTWSPPLDSPLNGKLYTYTNLGIFLKDLGVKSFGGLGYGISPSSTDSILAAEAAANAEGIKTCYTNNSVQFGAVDFTSDVLQIKSANCQGVAGSFVESSDLALSTAMKQAGLGGVTQVYFTGYDQATVATPSDISGFNNDYVQNGEINFSPAGTAATAFLKLLKTYDKSYTGGLPDFGLEGATISAQLAVYGLGLAGNNPTSASFTSALRKVTSWNDNGLLTTPATFAGLGTAAMYPKQECEYYDQLVNGKWQTFHNGPICGKLISLNAPS